MDRRRLLGISLAAVGGMAGFFASIPFVRSFLPSARARGLAEPVEIDVGALAPGEVRAYLYRGETMLVLRRTEDMLARIANSAPSAAADDPSYLDPVHRSIRTEYLVVSGVCTHLGCVPQHRDEQAGKRIAGDSWRGGFICPCHQSGFDYTGRVVKGPAPSDLRIPPHRYVGPTRVVIGEAPVPT